MLLVRAARTLWITVCQVTTAGLIGLLIAAMLAAEMSTDSSYLLTWSNILYNDLICPLANPKDNNPLTSLLLSHWTVELSNVSDMVEVKTGNSI